MFYASALAFAKDCSCVCPYMHFCSLHHLRAPSALYVYLCLSLQATFAMQVPIEMQPYSIQVGFDVLCCTIILRRGLHFPGESTASFVFGVFKWFALCTC